MKRDTEDLLDDLLKDDAPPGFHAALMNKTLRTARRRRHTARLVMAVCGVGLAAVAVLSFKSGPTPISSTERIHQSNKAASVNSTVPHSMIRIVTTQTDPHLKIIETDKLAKPALIDDRQLFALMGNQPAVLIRHGKENAELIMIGIDSATTVLATTEKRLLEMP